MPITHEVMNTIGPPFIVIRPMQMKGGYRIPSDLHVVVNAMFRQVYSAEERTKIMMHLHLFMTLARPPGPRPARGRVYIAWGNELEEVDLDACPKYDLSLPAGGV